MATGNIFLNAKSFYKTLDNVERKLKVLEKKKATVGLNVDEKAEEKYIKTAKEYLGLLEEKDKLESKRMGGKATQSDLKAYNDVNDAIDLTNKLLNKQTEQMKSIDKITVNQITRLKNLAEEQQVVNKAKRDEAKAIKESEEAEKQKSQIAKKEEREREQAAKEAERKKKESAIKAEKEKRQAIKETEKAEKEKAKAEEEAEKKAAQARAQAISERESNERKLIELKNKQQKLMRDMYDQENAQRLGKKKSKTSLDLIAMQEEFIMNNRLADELISKLGQSNQAVQHFERGLAFTERNNPLRVMRDEAELLIKKIPKLTKELNTLNKSPEKNTNQITGLEKQIEASRGRILEIVAEMQNAIQFEQDNNMQGNILSSEDYEWTRKAVDKLKEKFNITEQEIAAKQRELELDRQAQEQARQQEEKEKEYIETLKKRFALEEQLEKLKANKKQNRNQIKEIQEQIAALKQKEAELLKGGQLTDNNRRKVESETKAHERQIRTIQAKNKDLKDTGKTFGDTFKNFAKFTLYYALLNALRNAIQQAIETTKELDKAFTDIRLVTGDSKEKTAELAQSYNDLAKQMGSTTIEVAEGASEWLRQGKTTEETTELLKSSMTLSKVGAMEASEATELLTSSLNGYKMEAKDAMSIVDKISAIDLSAATSSYELATALSRTANSANDAGVSFEKLLGMIGTTSAVTRKSAETIRRII